MSWLGERLPVRKPGLPGEVAQEDSFTPPTIRTSAGKLIPLSDEYELKASMASRFSSAICCTERMASLARSFSDISDRSVQKSSTEMGARIENCKSRSDVAATPAVERTASNLPG